MSQLSPISVYQQIRQGHEEKLKELKRKQNLLGWVRLTIIVAFAIIGYFIFSIFGPLGWVVVGIGIAAFLAIVSIDITNNAKINHAKNLVAINEDELSVLGHQYQHLFNGSSYQPVQHAYAADIDLFGDASLYQLINRCYTEQGRELLATNLLKPLSIEHVKERNEAVKEIVSLLEWRQELQAIAMKSTVTVTTQKRIEQWLDTENSIFPANSWNLFLPVYAIITTSTAIATLFDYIPGPIFSFLFLIYFITGLTFSKRVMKAYLQLSGIVQSVDTLSELIDHIEKQSFKASLLRHLQSDLETQGGKAYKQIRQLKDTLNRFDLRLNVFVFFILNSFFLWDVWQMRALNKWKTNNRAVLPQAFSVVSAFEVVNSLATLHFNQPDWAFPKFEDFFTLQGKEIGHPLLPASKRVTSDFDLKGKGKVALVTGSNMAGKSTFLRSLAINIVLSQIGAPVCASLFKLSAMDVMSSMRIADNLAENTSTFYAELKKLESIIKAVKEHKPLFVLLDEILRGTNSLDRHIGSKALIRQLIKEQAVAIIATHDVELTQLKEEYNSAIDNYHFDVQVENNELYFDYQLKQGVCQSLNASLLMKKIGIEL